MLLCFLLCVGKACPKAPSPALHHHSPCSHIPAPASLIVILHPRWFCISMLLHLPCHAPASPCLKFLHPFSFHMFLHPPAMVLHPQFLLHPHPPCSSCIPTPPPLCIPTSHGPTPQIPSASPSPIQLHPHTSSFLHPHIPWSCIPIPSASPFPPSHAPASPFLPRPIPSSLDATHTTPILPPSSLSPRSLLGGLQHLQLLGGEPGEAVPGAAPLHHPCTRSPWDPNTLHEPPAAL